jgi:uncharacterized delta-60 repeat protein
MRTITQSASKWLLATRDYALLLGLIFGICASVFGEEPPVEQWVARYNGQANSGDGAQDLAVDNSGSVYVTGYSYGSDTGYDYATVKYSPDGNQLWVARYNGPGNDYDTAQALAVDNSGNVYVTGYSYDSNMRPDYATIKYGPGGNQLWLARYNGTGNDWDEAHALAVDNSGNVYVTGCSYGGSTHLDYATIKYSPDGNQLWVRRYNGPGNNIDIPWELAVDSSGNVYVTGYTSTSGSNYDYATIKYNTDGSELWVERYNSPWNEGDQATALAVDNSGNVYVTGRSDTGTSADYATVKYNPDGNQIWVSRYNGDANLGDWAYALAVDSSHNVYVTGLSTVNDQNEDYATVKYGPDGNQLWVSRYNGPGNGYERAYDLAVDNSGNVYVTGYSPGSGTGNDYATVKYSPGGNQLWVARYNGPENGNDQATALAADNSGNVYVTGQSYGDYATIKYTQEHLNCIYVDANATGANDGSSWANAYKYLQNALWAAEPNYEIRVAQGTYRPDEDTSNPGGTNDANANFYLRNDVAIYGGFPSGGGLWASRDPNIYKAILSGDIGVADNNSDNSYHVTTSWHCDSSAILDGFTITAGNAASGSGGGISNYESSPTITNCTFIGNSAFFGGGMSNGLCSSIVLTNCNFIGNSAPHSGGMGVWDCNNMTLTDCTFSGNSADNYGGMWVWDCNVILTGCTFSGNSAGQDGGGMSVWDCNMTLTDCTFSGNSANDYGGGMFVGSDSNVVIADCSFNGNSAQTGSGIYTSGTSNVINVRAGGSISTTDDFNISGYSQIRGTGSIVIELGGEMIIDSNAVVDLNDPNDPNATGTIQCDGLIKVKDNGQLKHATVNVSRQAGGVFGKLQVEDSAQAKNLDIHADGDRFMEVDPCTFTGTIANNRIYVTITEGKNGSDDGILEVRGLDFTSPPCDFNDINVLACYLDSGDMPPFDMNSWTLERLEVAAGAKLSLVNRFSSGNGDPEVLYVKNVVLGDDCVLKVGFERFYYTNLSGEPNSIIKGSLLGFSVGDINSDSNEQFQSRVSSNNYINPADPNSNKIYVERVTGLEPDPNGMIKMSNLQGGDGNIISARAKGEFAPVCEDEIRIQLNYLFTTTDPLAQIVVYLSDVPELLDHNDPNRGAHYIEVARIPAPPAPRPGSAGSNLFGDFEIYTSTWGLDLTKGTWIEMELVEPGQSQILGFGGSKGMRYQATEGGEEGTIAYTDNWSVGVYCEHGICLDLDWDGEVEVSDFLIVVSGNGRSNASCLDGSFSRDGYVDSYDSDSWDWTINLDGRRNMCGKMPLGGSGGSGFSYSRFGAFSGPRVLLSQDSSGGELFNLSDLNDLLICGKKGTTDSQAKLSDRLYVFDSNTHYIQSLDPNSDRYNIRIVRGVSDDLYQINSEDGVVDETGTQIVPQGQVTCDTNEPRYNRPAAVYVGVQKRWTNDEPDYFGRPIIDAAFDANYVYVVPVVVEPYGNEPNAYAAAAKIQLAPPHHVVKLYDGPLTPFDYNYPQSQLKYRNNLREIELDNAGNVYVTNANRINADILWKFEPNGAVLRRDFYLNNPIIRSPAGMFVSRTTNILYLGSSLYDSADPNSKTIYGFSTQDFNHVRTITVSGMQHLTGITEDPITGALWVTGFSMNCVPPLYPSPMSMPFYDPYLAMAPRLPLDVNVTAVRIWDPNDPNNDLAMPLSICWTGALPPPELCGGADLNKNGTVNLPDLAILARHWRNTDCSAPNNPCEGADLEPQAFPDGDVDLKDLDVLAEYWLNTNCQ